MFYAIGLYNRDIISRTPSYRLSGTVTYAVASTFDVTLWSITCLYLYLRRSILINQRHSTANYISQQLVKIFMRSSRHIITCGRAGPINSTGFLHTNTMHSNTISEASSLALFISQRFSEIFSCSEPRHSRNHEHLWEIARNHFLWLDISTHFMFADFIANDNREVNISQRDNSSCFEMENLWELSQRISEKKVQVMPLGEYAE
jgi:hypothetical protein